MVSYIDDDTNHGRLSAMSVCGWRWRRFIRLTTSFPLQRHPYPVRPIRGGLRQVGAYPPSTA
jgi:hypothetical protein